ncbi:MAG: hypothetical protein DMF73_08165 [Acidobacteria bacterium]|nr:MAG: hypothetical protein DMF73_08165 [Acidobacteriota bacterium]
MRISIRFLPLSILSAAILVCAACQSTNQNANTTATTSATPPGAQQLTQVSRPQTIEQMMKDRGEQDQAKPTLRIVSPANNATINGSTVEVKLELGGDLKGYMPHKDPATGKGNHIHVILDNEPYEAYYELNQGPFELRNVSEGWHTLRVFPSRPWHESYKNDGAFQMVEFTVKGGGDASKPTTTNSGDKMANPAKPESATASPTPSREGKDYSASQGGNIDRTKPLLTYSRPKGEYKGADADPIMIDFWLLNAKLQGDGGEYRVRYSVDGGQPTSLDKWEPIWLTGWINGKHRITLELIDPKTGNVVDNGGYNSTTREITISR